MGEKRRCFVVGPIGKEGSPERKHADMLLNAVVREVLESDDLGYEVVRSDEVADPGMVNDKVIHDIIGAELVVADLTFLNPNVFYELGIRHAALKPVIHIAQAGTSLPFDNSGYRAIVEDITDWRGMERAREKLRNAAKSIEVPGYKVSNPITQANASFQMQESADPKERMWVDVADRLDRIERRVASGSVSSSVIEMLTGLIEIETELKQIDANEDQASWDLLGAERLALQKRLGVSGH